MESKRIEYIDLAKGICIILVVFMHLVPELIKGNPFFSNLRMPLYYCLSGLFFKSYGSFKNFLIKKSDKLLIPLVAWFLISHFIYYLRVWAIGYPERHFYMSDFFLEDDFYNGVLWFLLSLFWCNIIYFGIEKFSKNELIRVAVILSISTIGWFITYSDLRNFLYIGTSLTCLPFFYMGKLFLKYNLVSKTKTPKKDLLIGGICLLIILSSILLPEEPPLYIFYLNRLESGLPVFVYFAGSSLCLAILLVCKYINKIPFVSYLGRYSIIVLVTHRLIQNIFTRGIEHLTGLDMSSTSSRFILFFIIIALMSIIIPLCKKFLPHICAQKPVLDRRASVPSSVEAI